MRRTHRSNRRREGRGRRFALALACIALLLAAWPSPTRAKTDTPEVGIDEKLGETIPLDLSFFDEAGKAVTLRSLLSRPTVLTLVYFRCPGICSPLMHEVADTVEELDLVAGIDYDLVTVSFDDRETSELASTAKRNLLGGMKKKIPPESWRFLTGSPESIAALTEGVGFRYKRDRDDFVHAATVIFLSKDGKIVRYLGGLKLLPADMKMAILDAAEGTPRTLMQRIQRLCYAYDPAGKTYVFKVNRIILAVTLAGAAIFVLYLLLARRKSAAPSVPPAAREATAERPS